MASPEYYRTLAQRCREVAIRKGKRRERTNPYLLALADRFEEAARADHAAFAGDKPSGQSGGRRAAPSVRERTGSAAELAD